MGMFTVNAGHLLPQVISTIKGSLQKSAAPRLSWLAVVGCWHPNSFAQPCLQHHLCARGALACCPSRFSGHWIAVSIYVACMNVKRQCKCSSWALLTCQVSPSPGHTQDAHAELAILPRAHCHRGGCIAGVVWGGVRQICRQGPDLHSIHTIGGNVQTAMKGSEGMCSHYKACTHVYAEPVFLYFQVATWDTA